MSFMKSSAIFSIILVSLTLLACGTQPQYQALGQEKQVTKIDLWHHCVEKNLRYLNANSKSADPEESIQHTLFACQGYREDVLATFPLRLEHSLNSLMVKQTYEAGYTAFAHKKGSSVLINSVTLDTLKRKLSKP